ncbi:MAG: nickel-dependent hydrogenase large subunit [Halarcobacter sp.]
MKTIDLVERIEGEAKLVCSWENEKISDARIEFLNFRGFEYILKNKPILDALVYTPRICGICGQAHLLATVNLLENLYKNAGVDLQVTQKAKLLREIGLNIEIIDSHIKWFYMFIMPDIIKLSSKKFNEYTPLKGKNWLEALGCASETIKALAIIGGQWPHTSYMIPGGVVSDPTLMDIATMKNYLDSSIRFFEKSLINMEFEKYLDLSKTYELSKIGGHLKEFIDISFENDFENIGKSYDRHLSLGESALFEKGRLNKRVSHKIDLKKIYEDDSFAYSLDKDEENPKAYGWAKTVKYDNLFYETGPLSRALISNRKLLKDVHSIYEDSLFTRVLARMDELAHLLYSTKELISKIDINEESYIKPQIKLDDLEHSSALSVVEACRGSLFHEATIRNGKIEEYNVITPTVWNLGPGDNNTLGTTQKAIVGTDSIEKAKIILRSFDVCSVCTTH